MKESSYSHIDASDATRLGDVVLMGSRARIISEAFGELTPGVQHGVIISMNNGQKFLSTHLLHITSEVITAPAFKTNITYFNVDNASQVTIFVPADEKQITSIDEDNTSLPQEG